MSLDAAIARAVAEEVAKLVRDMLPTGHPDDLVRLPGPLQKRSAMALVRSHRLPASKIGRPRTGRIERRKSGSFFCRILLKDGTTSGRIDLSEARTAEDAKAIARAIQASEDKTQTLYVAALADRARAKNQSAAGAARPGTTDAWWGLYIASKVVGSGHRRVERSNWNKWISPVIGKLAMATLQAEDIERVRDRLDAAIKAGKITSGTAENIWSTLTTAMLAATNAKGRDLRVHVRPHYLQPVHTGILPPNGGRDRSRPFLYPSEWAVLAACAEVPAEWRRIYALAVYTGLRPGELRVLTWDDIEVEAGLLRVNKAWDLEERVVKTTKTEQGHRLVPLRPEIRHLLVRPRGVAGRELVVDETLDKAAPRFRAHLKMAGVTRARLFTRSATELPVDFRALRDTYATWRSLQGVEAYVLRREMGHESLETTDRYIRTAHAVRDAAIGTPFPAFGPFLEGLAALGNDGGVSPSVSPPPQIGHDPMVNYPAPTVGLEPDNTGGFRQKSAQIVSEGATQNATIGAVPPAFLLPGGASAGSDGHPAAGLPESPFGAEVGLYGVLEREELASLQGLGSQLLDVMGVPVEDPADEGRS